MSKIIKNVMRGHMSTVILGLLEANNTITTLEVKTELRGKYPEFSWKQADVSDFMNEMHLEGDLTYEDNGTYRIYSGEVTKTTSTKKDSKGKVLAKIKPKKISKTKALELMSNCGGRFFTAEFVNKEDEVRVMNCQYIQGQDHKLGYVKVREASKMRSTPKDCIRQINLQTIKSLKIAGVAYKIS